MAFILAVVEEQLSELLYKISEDYKIDYEELCERYLGTVEVPRAPKAPRKAAKKAAAEDVEMCRGRTAKGQPCKKKAAEGCDGFCKTHAPKADSEEEEGESEGPKICCGRTAKGQKCKKRATSGSDYCKTHEPKMDELDMEEEEEEKPVLCKGLTGKKQPCKKKAVCDGYCKTHQKGPFKLKEPEHNHEPGEPSEGCDSCTLYGNPVEEETDEIEIQPRRSERIKLQKLLENVEQEKMDEEELEELQDLESFAADLEKSLEEED